MAYQNITGAKLAQYSTAAGLSAKVYTSPADTRTYVKDIDICNTTATSATASVYLVGNSATAGTTNALLYNVTIPAYSNMQWTGAQIINSGDFVQVQASISGVVFNITGGLAT